MIGTGTIINAVAIIAGGVIGLMGGRFMNEQMQDSLQRTSGIAVLFIAIAGAMAHMLEITESGLSSGYSILITVCLALGAVVGELINIEQWFERFGEWLKVKTHNARDNQFVDAFVTASLTVSIGAMAIVGAIEDGITGDWSILAAKAILDLIIIMVMTCSMGKGCIFSAIPVFVFQGSITLLAVLIKPLMTDLALSYISLVGSILIFCVGLNLVWGKRIRVANLLPSLVFAVIAAFLPM